VLIICCDDRLQRLDVERLFGHNLFQPPVLVLKRLQSLHLTELHPTEISRSSGSTSAP